jgi:hypothetical protein
MKGSAVVDAGTTVKGAYTLLFAIAQASLPVPEHSIEHACGRLEQQSDVARCTRAEEIHRSYVMATWSMLSLSEQQQAQSFNSRKYFYYEHFYRDLSNYIEAKLRDRRQIE